MDDHRDGNLAAGVALIVTMIVYSGDSARWIAFALGCAMVGVSLLALAVHEITTERVRHELEVANPTARIPSRPVDRSVKDRLNLVRGHGELVPRHPAASPGHETSLER